MHDTGGRRQGKATTKCQAWGGIKTGDEEPKHCAQLRALVGKAVTTMYIQSLGKGWDIYWEEHFRAFDLDQMSPQTTPQS